MALTLRAAMEEMLEGWRGDLEPGWRALADDTALDFAGIDPDLVIEPWEPVFPARRGRAFPGAPNGAHLLRAFDGIAPAAVTCVILGQDPYPCPAFATGRAFEAGNVAAWREFEKMFSCSMRTLLQLIVAARTGDASYARTIGDWPRTIDDIESGRVDLPAPSDIAEGWVGQGVLLLNTALTLSRFAVTGDPHQRRGHLKLWRPFLLAVLRRLAERGGAPIVFIGFGDHAADALARAGIADRGRQARLLYPHPAAGDAVLARGNPFVAGNAALQAIGARPVLW